MSPKLSAVVPTLNEAATIAPLVRALRRECDEVIVVDADSEDGTAELARAAGARLGRATGGRGPQLNHGAALASGELLVFVHADTGVPAGFGEAIARAMRDDVVGGNFRLRFEPRSAAADLFSLANHWRRRLLGIYYGDSCLFVRRTHFLAMGGFPNAPLFEDHAFVQRLERSGRTCYLQDPVVRTSARRFADRPLRTLALWAGLQAAYGLGASPYRLARFYRAVR